MKLRVLTLEDVKQASSMKQAIDSMRDALGQLARGRARVPLRLIMEAEAGLEMLMPAYLQDTRALGLKILSIYNGNPQRGLRRLVSVVMVLDIETGVPVALMDGIHITALRTGAGTGLATDLLAREDASVLTVFGAGVQARTQIEGVRAVRDIQEVRILDSGRGDSARRLAEELQGVTTTIMTDRRAAVRGADIIIAATSSKTPVFDGNDIEPGTHINGIGSYTPAMQEVDSTLIQHAKIVVLSHDGEFAEAGDLIIPLEQGLITRESVHAVLGEIVNGTKPGRVSRDEITFYKSVGNAAQDVAVAQQVLQEADAKGLGSIVEL